jgi:outer membrane protein assembly factor BamA
MLFLTAVLPLRGYNYSEMIGSKYFLMNYELRFPLIRYLVPGPLPILFSNILGVAYIDAGTAWNNTSAIQLFNRNEDGKL